MNATTNNSVSVSSSVATPKGKGTVSAIAKGWVTVLLANGTEVKARAKDVSLVGVEKPGYVRAGIATYDPSRYTTHKDTKTASGRASFDIADTVANKLRGKTLDEVYAIAAPKLGESIKALRARYEHLNPGQQRMCVGNRLRHA